MIRIPVARAAEVPLGTAPIAEIRAGLQGALLPAFEAAQDAVHELLLDGGGCVVFSAPAGGPLQGVVIAAVHGLARSIVREYGRLGVRALVVVGGGPEDEARLAAAPALAGELVALVDGDWGTA